MKSFPDPRAVQPHLTETVFFGFLNCFDATKRNGMVRRAGVGVVRVHIRYEFAKCESGTPLVVSLESGRHSSPQLPHQGGRCADAAFAEHTGRVVKNHPPPIPA